MRSVREKKTLGTEAKERIISRGKLRVFRGVLALFMSPIIAHCTGTEVRQEGATRPKLFRYQYGIKDPSFCNAPVCVDFDGDGKREIVFASRGTGEVRLLNAADGKLLWASKVVGQQQSIMACDLEGRGEFTIIYTTSNPGTLYSIDRTGKVLNSWISSDNKLGNSPVVIDADGDGVLEGFFGTRSQELVRLDMRTFRPLTRRAGWQQCGCYTSAMDVDKDGVWDLFAGSGDDTLAKGTFHRYDPRTLKSSWSYPTNDNAASADPVLVDIDGDGRPEILKGVDNFAGDDSHEGVFAFTPEGKLLWKAAGFGCEGSPNAADFDGDGEVEIVGMTFGGVVFCLDARGRVRWKKDLRPELGESAHAYMTPILCDVDGKPGLEILVMTNGGYFDRLDDPKAAHGVIFALDARGDILDRLDVGGPRYWGAAFYANVDDDPEMELVVSGSGGMDVIKTRGRGPNVEVFMKHRTYQRLDVVPWAYEDSYFIHRGRKEDVVNLTDNLVLRREAGRYVPSGRFTTEILTLPPQMAFQKLGFEARQPEGTTVKVHLEDEKGNVLLRDVKPEQSFRINQAVRIVFVLSTSAPEVSPLLDSYVLRFAP